MNLHEIKLIQTLPVFTGKSYRADYGSHAGDISVFDILVFEHDILGNHNTVYANEQILEILKKVSGKSVCWVTRSYDTALQYGQVEYWPVGEEARIIAEDEDAGCLVMYGDLIREPSY